MSQRSGSSRPKPDLTERNLMSNSAVHNPRTLPPIQDSRPEEAPCSAGHGPQSSQHAAASSSELQRGIFSRTAGPLGMQNLLNPTNSTNREESTSTDHRRSVNQLGHAPATNVTTGTLPALQVSQGQNMAPLPSITPPHAIAQPGVPGQTSRRILTPRTPSSSENNPLSKNIGFAGATIDAKVSPFMPSRDHMHGRETMMPSLPPLSVGIPMVELSHSNPPTRSPSGYSTGTVASQVPLKQERRASGGAISSQLPASQSNSPSTTYSSYSRFSNTPPATTQPSSFFHQPFSDPKSASNVTRSKGSYNSLSNSAAQNTYQLMTLDTEQGPIQVPIDVQAASKVADEKRKRNATASHRFRQRRKEKERETSNNIAKLEHQIREIAEEREFYRMERDFFRTVACNKSGQAHLPRPPSPRQVRLAQAVGNGHLQGQEDDSRNDRNTRRRTSSYTPATGFHPPANAGPPQLPGYPLAMGGPVENVEQRAATRPKNSMAGSSLQHGSVDPSSYHIGWKA